MKSADIFIIFNDSKYGLLQEIVAGFSRLIHDLGSHCEDKIIPSTPTSVLHIS